MNKAHIWAQQRGIPYPMKFHQIPILQPCQHYPDEMNGMSGSPSPTWEKKHLYIPKSKLSLISSIPCKTRKTSKRDPTHFSPIGLRKFQKPWRQPLPPHFPSLPLLLLLMPRLLASPPPPLLPNASPSLHFLLCWFHPRTGPGKPPPTVSATDVD